MKIIHATSYWSRKEEALEDRNLMIEETLQSIDDTLKRIEIILQNQQRNSCYLAAVQGAVSDAILENQRNPLKLLLKTQDH